MTTTVQKWGNSLAVRIPTRIAESISMEQGTEIELTVGKTGIMLKPKNNKPTLDDLLARVTRVTRAKRSSNVGLLFLGFNIIPVFPTVNSISVPCSMEIDSAIRVGMRTARLFPHF